MYKKEWRELEWVVQKSTGKPYEKNHQGDKIGGTRTWLTETENV